MHDASRLVIALVSLAIVAFRPSAESPAVAGIVTFGDTFAYAIGPLAGNNGGTGWSGAYGSGGGGQAETAVIAGLSGTDPGTKAIQVSNFYTVPNTRSFPSIDIATTSTFAISFLFNSTVSGSAIHSNGGGVLTFGPVMLGTGNNYGTAGFGIQDSRDGNRVSRPSGFSANTTYVVLADIRPGTNAGTRAITLYGSSDLGITAASLMTPGNQWARTDFFNDFTMSSFGNFGDGTGSFRVASVAGATDAATALAYTIPTAVPELAPAMGSSALSLVAGLLALIEKRRRRAAVMS